MKQNQQSLSKILAFIHKTPGQMPGVLCCIPRLNLVQDHKHTTRGKLQGHPSAKAQWPYKEGLPLVMADYLGKL